MPFAFSLTLKQKYFFAFIVGILYSFGFAPYHLWFLVFISVAGLFYVIQGLSIKDAAKVGWFYGLGSYGFGVYWLYNSLHLFGDAIAPLSAAITGLFVAILSLYFSLYAAIAAALLSKRSQLLGTLFLLPALWVLTEWLRSWLFTGFPWLSLGYAHTQSPLHVLAPIGGVWLLSLVSAVYSSCLLLFFRGLKFERLIGGVFALCLSALLVLLSHVSWVNPFGEVKSVALIQPNIAQHQKFNEGFLEKSLNIHTELSFSDDVSAEIVLWPESAVPTWYEDVALPLQSIANDAEQRGMSIVTGIFTYDSNVKKFYNSIRVLGPDPQLYHKSHLVPFGEYIPFRAVLDLLKNYILVPMSDLSPGPSTPIPLSVSGIQLAASVCYEDAFGEEVIRQLPDANVLINVSNDAWFGDSSAPWQHLQMAQMRAIETGRPMMRATNTGVSAIIDHQGVVQVFAEVGVRARVDGVIQPMSGETPFVRWSNWPVVGFSFVLLFIYLLLSRRF